jgi:WD40 repeat protein
MASIFSTRGFLPAFFLLLTIVNSSIAQKPVLTVPSGHSAWLTDYEVSRDGKYMVTGSYDNTVKLWDYASGRELVTLSGHQNVVESVAFSPDGRTIASGSYDGTIKFWDVATGKLKHSWESYWNRNKEIEFSPDGKSIVFTSDSACLVYDLQGDSVKWWIQTQGRTGKAKFFQKGERIAVLDWMPPGEMSTIFIYDAVSGELFEDQSFYYRHGDILDFTISPSGRYMFTVVNTDSLNVRVHDLVMGRDVKRLHGHLAHPRYVTTGPDDSTFYSVVYNNVPLNASTEIKRWNWTQSRCTDSVVFSNLDIAEELWYQFVSSSDQVIVPTSAVALDVFKGGTLERVRRIEGHSSGMNDMAALPGRLVISSDDCTLKELDLKRGELSVPIRNPFPDQNLHISRMFMSRDSSSFFCTSRASEYVVKCSPRQKPTVVYKADTLIFKSDFDRASGRMALYTFSESGHGVVTLIDTLGKVISKKKLPWEHYDYCTLLSFTGDDRVLFQVMGVDSLTLWDYRKNTFSFIADTVKKNSHWEPAVLDRDRILLTGFAGMHDVVNIKSGTWEKRWRADYLTQDLELNRSRSTSLEGLADGDIHLLNNSTWRVEKTLRANNSPVTQVGYMAMDNVIYAFGLDNMLHFWNITTNELLASMTVVDTSEWVVVKQGGLFDASPDAMKLIYYVVNDSLDKDEPWKIIQLDQLKHRYYQPGLLPIQMGYSKEALREVPSFENIEFAPKVVASVTGSILKIKVTDQRGGIGPVSVLLNGAEIAMDVRPEVAKTKPGRVVEIDFNLKPYYARMGADAEIKIIAWNKKEWIRSNPTVVKFTPSPSSKGVETEVSETLTQHDQRLFGVIVGTSEYAGTDIDLRYAAKDARDFYVALQMASENLFGKDKTKLTLLTTDEKDLTLHPTKKNITNVFTSITSQIKPEDILIVYFSGHGVSVSGDNGDFYYATMQTSGMDLSNMKDPAIQQRAGLSSSELTATFNKIAATKKILILDACNSGKAAETMTTQVKDIPASQVRALDRMKDRTGFYVLSGSAADAVSYESSVYGQGLLTYALLKAMKGASLRVDGAEEYVDVQKLFYYAVEQVPLLAAGIGGIQKPLYRSPDDQRSFDIGKMDEGIKKAIIISEPKPVFIASSFQDQLQLFDVIGLSDAMNAALRENAAKGKQATFIFTEAKDYPGAYRASGNYKEEGDELVISYVIIKDKKIVDAPKIFRHKKADAKIIADALLAQLQTSVQP